MLWFLKMISKGFGKSSEFMNMILCPPPWMNGGGGVMGLACPHVSPTVDTHLLNHLESKPLKGLNKLNLALSQSRAHTTSVSEKRATYILIPSLNVHTY